MEIVERSIWIPKMLHPDFSNYTCVEQNLRCYLVNSVDEKNKLLLGPKLANDCYRTLKSQIFLPSDKILSETNWNLLTTSLWSSFQYRIAKITFQEYSFKFRFHKFRKVYLHASWNFYRTNLLILIVIN